MNFTQCKVLTDAAGNPTGIIVTPKVKLVYPSLFKPSLSKGEKDESKARYQATLLFPKASDLAPIAARYREIVAEKISPAALKTTKVKNPFLKVTEEDQPKIWNKLASAGLDPLEFPAMLRCSAKIKPTVKAPDMTEVVDEDQVYDGRWCRASIRLYWYDHPTGGKGVSAGLNNIQLLDHDTPLPRGGSSNADDEFEAVSTAEGGASADSVFA